MTVVIAVRVVHEPLEVCWFRLGPLLVLEAPMDYETLNVTPDGALLTVRFNRPEKRNAVNRQMHLEIQAVCRQLEDDTDTRVVLFAGEGGVFSSGADTGEWRESGPSNELAVRRNSGIGSRTSAAI